MGNLTLNLRIFSQIIRLFIAYLERGLENDRQFEDNELPTFVRKANSLNEFQRAKQCILGPKGIEKIKFGWFSKIKMLEEAIVGCLTIDDKRGNAFLKAIKFVEHLQGP